MGMNILEFNLLGEKPENQKEFDLKYEEYQRNLKLTDPIILESRLGFLCQPQAFKVFLDVSDEVASKRILGDNRATDSFNSLQEAFEATRQRNLKDQERYLRLYNINLRDHAHYSSIIDTSNLDPHQVVEQIITGFQAFQNQRSSQ